MKLPYLGLYHSFLGQPNGRSAPNRSTSPQNSRFLFNRPVPRSLKGPQWRLRPLQSAHTTLTYETYLRNPQALLRPGNNTEPYTWEDHTRQIAEAEKDFWAGEKFSLTLLNTQENRCLGGVQIAPLRPFFHYHHAPNHFMIRADPNSAMITCWFCHTCPEGNFAAQFVTALHRWLLTDWELTDHLFRVNPSESKTITILEAAGLRPHLCLPITVPPYQYAFYGR